MIRAATPSDLDGIMRVEQAAHSHPWTSRVMQGYLQKADCCWVWLEQQQIQAHAVMSVVATEAELLTLAVHPVMQGQGLGRLLLKQVIAEAQRKQAEQIFLEVRESNQSAITLYETSGFCELGRRNRYYPKFDTQGNPAGREDALLYGLPL